MRRPLPTRPSETRKGRMPLRAWFILAAVAVPALVLLLLLVSRPGTEAQVERAFAQIQAGLAEGDASRIMDMVDADYDVVGQWPQLEPVLGGRDRGIDRDRVRSMLGQYLFLQRQRGNLPHLTWKTAEVRDVGEDRVVAVVELGLKGTTGSLVVTLDPPRSGLTFTFRRSGWLRPKLAVLSHDPLQGSLNLTN